MQLLGTGVVVQMPCPTFTDTPMIRNAQADTVRASCLPMLVDQKTSSRLLMCKADCLYADASVATDVPGDSAFYAGAKCGESAWPSEPVDAPHVKFHSSSIEGPGTT